MENLGKLTLGFIMIALGFCLSLLEVYIVLSIASLYALDFINRFSFIQVFGLLLIYGIVKYTYKKEKAEKEQDFTQNMKDSALRILTMLLVLLLSWGFAFVAHWIIS